MISDSSFYDAMLQIGQIDQQACCRKDDEKLFEISQQDLFLSNRLYYQRDEGCKDWGIAEHSERAFFHSEEYEWQKVLMFSNASKKWIAKLSSL